ncbi:hypothetical protein SPRG_04653 [Saprolegnia parasitica CBS 223.65]|uniref:Polymerase/histidinol phosphatase N-terminal domain-containing protein n=1 Tax=Saprolegnia parasitica (strain CBS 223.65) TaxID=695850 RepID=A0A067CVE3_SAPPC|nr:hypothetical protein SPRG_04653 [Saprolegnia parasitica CBS 223.65]KDO30752.1 hypothetical protein SPRG_04653 [Saprolegnia parasitica CBS 223.65]|eukprot:XP_012198452.1 hypothetical protein SPRG_04653 [Saprolegnia parasitica CBS 223.65]
MVQSSSSKKKKSSKPKSSKRKPVNLQPTYQSKFARHAAGSDDDPDSPSPSMLAHDLFPSNHEEMSLGDFHLHSTCSDGKFRPAEVIAKAAANGVQYMSLTDHDTMAGVDEALAAARDLGVFVMPGVEISAEEKGAENMHILGYFCPGTESVELEAQLLLIRQARHKRGQEMLRKLAAMGIHLDWNRVLEIAGEAAPGRPHVAEALVEAGHVAHFREAFARYLGNDGPAYAEGEHFPPEAAIKMITEAGGISVLAHPWCCKNPLLVVPKLAAAGINGVEVYHDVTKIDLYGSLATESKLLKLGGSDFHGIDPHTEHAPGDIPLPRKHLDKFLAAAKDMWAEPLRKKVAGLCAGLGGEPSTLVTWSELLPVVEATVATYPAVQLSASTENHYSTIVLTAA